MEMITLRRDGQRPLSFEGELLADSDGKWVSGRDQNRYYDLAVYRASDGRFVAHWHYRTNWQGETDHSRVEIYASPKSVAEALEGFDPCAWITAYRPIIAQRAGYDSGRDYETRQASLESAIRDRYAAQVEDLCAALQVSAPLPPVHPPTVWGVRYDADLAEMVLLGPGSCEIVVRGFEPSRLTREQVVDEALMGSLEQLQWAYALEDGATLELISTRDRAKLSSPVLHILHLSTASWHLEDTTAYMLHSVPRLNPEQAKRLLAWAEGR